MDATTAAIERAEIVRAANIGLGSDGGESGREDDEKGESEKHVCVPLLGEPLECAPVSSF